MIWYISPNPNSFPDSSQWVLSRFFAEILQPLFNS
jgi:hypothetical protein